MSRKHTLTLMLLVVLPLLAFYALGRRLVMDERERTERQFEELLRAHLSETDRTIAAYFSRLEQQLLRTSLPLENAEDLQQQLRREPRFEQILVLNADGTLVFPDPNGPLTRQETDYLMKIEPLISDRTFFRPTASRDFSNQRGGSNSYLPVKMGVGLPQFVAASPTNEALVSNGMVVADSGWHTWYFGPGIQLIHWRRLPDGGVLAIGLQRARWMSEVISLLPNAAEGDAGSPAQIRLVDAAGQPVYVWGTRQPLESELPRVSLHLSEPLRPWQLEHFGPAIPLGAGSSAMLINLLASGGVLFIGLTVLASYLFREFARASREARERVTFVNQVSHELKTPLTNIRMYADLLEQDLARLDTEEDERAQSHLAVITSESGRLSRLINNVLAFARIRRGQNGGRLQRGSVDQVIGNVIEQFRPGLEEREFQIRCDLQAPQEMSLDIDALEQILGNLISNVEKYAEEGKLLEISSRRSATEIIVDVSDAGPGIPPEFAPRLFEPFARASDHIQAATGTGIGLPIARGLARRCGGDLQLSSGQRGACFRLTIPIHAVEKGGVA